LHRAIQLVSELVCALFVNEEHFFHISTDIGRQYLCTENKAAVTTRSCAMQPLTLLLETVSCRSAAALPAIIKLLSRGATFKFMAFPFGLRLLRRCLRGAVLRRRVRVDGREYILIKMTAVVTLLL
jgi:hypothetical protein